VASFYHGGSSLKDPGIDYSQVAAAADAAAAAPLDFGGILVAKEGEVHPS
jgi:hypothetical protein